MYPGDIFIEIEIHSYQSWCLWSCSILRLLSIKKLVGCPHFSNQNICSEYYNLKEKTLTKKVDIVSVKKVHKSCSHTIFFSSKNKNLKFVFLCMAKQLLTSECFSFFFILGFIYTCPMGVNNVDVFHSEDEKKQNTKFVSRHWNAAFFYPKDGYFLWYVSTFRNCQ